MAERLAPALTPALVRACLGCSFTHNSIASITLPLGADCWQLFCSSMAFAAQAFGAEACACVGCTVRAWCGRACVAFRDVVAGNVWIGCQLPAIVAGPLFAPPTKTLR